MSILRNKKDAFFPLAVAMHKKHIVFFYSVKTNGGLKLYLSRSKDGLDFKKMHELEIISEDGKKENIGNYSTFNFSSFGNEHYLIYSRKTSRIFRKKIETVIAKSTNLIHFKVIDRIPSELFEKLAVISNHKHKKSFLAYHGTMAIHAAASDDLKSWHATGELLAPRKDYFDSHSLHLIDALVTYRGILVIYETKENAKDSHEIKIGAALFSLDQPYRLLWRSDAPIWKKVIDNEDYPLKPLSCVLLDNALYVYWTSRQNEIIITSVNPAAMGLRKAAVSQLNRHPKNPILKPDLKNKWECEATFNPAALHLSNKVHLLYRAIGENGVSVFGYASSEDGFHIDERLKYPAYVPSSSFEYSQSENAASFYPYTSGGGWGGCEDPRLSQVEDNIFMIYTTFNGGYPPGVALTSIKMADFLDKNWDWKKSVLISPPGEINKNWVIFPEKINGKFALLHSFYPKILIDYFDSMDQFDGKKFIRSDNTRPTDHNRTWDSWFRGVGPSPIKTKRGWLVLYHAMNHKNPDRYRMGALLLDLKDPSKVLYRSKYPILEPEEVYENCGHKWGVVYSCGAIVKDGTLFVYYGGSDSVVCVATANLDKFLQDIIKGVADEPAKLQKINKPIEV